MKKKQYYKIIFGKKNKDGEEIDLIFLSTETKSLKSHKDLIEEFIKLKEAYLSTNYLKKSGIGSREDIKAIVRLNPYYQNIERALSFLDFQEIDSSLFGLNKNLIKSKDGYYIKVLKVK